MRQLLTFLALFLTLVPYRTQAQECQNVGGEITFIYNTIEDADRYLLPSGDACDMSEAMEHLVEMITSDRYANIPIPHNYIEYFSGIPEDVIAYPMWYSGEDDAQRQEAIADFYVAIEAMQDYADGRRADFPLEPLMKQVDRALSAYDDAIYEGVCLSSPYRLLAYRLLQQMLLLAPSIDMVATSVSVDGTLAVLDASLFTYYTRPVLSPIFIYDKRDEVWRVIMLTDVAPRGVEEIEDIDF